MQVAFLPPIAPQPEQGPGEVSNLINERVWPAVREEYGRLRANAGVIAAGLAALGVGGGVLATRRHDARRWTRSLGKVEPRKLRRQNTRRRVLKRLRSLR